MDEYPEFVVIVKTRTSKLYAILLVKAETKEEAISACRDEIPEGEGMKVRAIEVDENWGYLIPARVL